MTSQCPAPALWPANLMRLPQYLNFASIRSWLAARPDSRRERRCFANDAINATIAAIVVVSAAWSLTWRRLPDVRDGVSQAFCWAKRWISCRQGRLSSQKPSANVAEAVAGLPHLHYCLQWASSVASSCCASAAVNGGAESAEITAARWKDCHLNGSVSSNARLPFHTNETTCQMHVNSYWACPCPDLDSCVGKLSVAQMKWYYFHPLLYFGCV